MQGKLDVRHVLVVIANLEPPLRLRDNPMESQLKQFLPEKSRHSTTNMTMRDVLDEIGRRRDVKALKGMSRFGIDTSRAFGVSVPQLRDLAKKTGRNHELAQQLWKTGIHEARILAGMIDDPTKVTEDQMDNWAKEFDSWDIVDGSCGNLFDKTPFAVRKAHEWSARPEEYVKRAGFVLMAEIAVHDRKAADRTFLEFLPVIVRESSDERNFVKKAVNWALRQIGKRNMALNKAAIGTGKALQKLDSRPAKWIAADALRELTNPEIQARLKAL
jgi:3-methyladenine DNA glycosylase AlkD